MCWVSVVWNSAVLPAVVVRNVALTHRPLRMPDRLAAELDLPTASPRDLIASAGVPAPVLAALPTRLDTGSETGAFLEPERAGPVLARVLATASLAPDERLVLARLLAVLRAGERAGLAVWESMDTGPIVEVPAGAPTSLCWPGLGRPLLAALLTEDEWAQLDGAEPWSLALGDLEDLVIATCWIAPDDRARVPSASRVLRRSFLSSGALFVDDLLPRALGWLEATLAAPDLAGASVIAYAHLEGSAKYRVTPRPLPPAAMMRAAEIAAAEDLPALVRLYSERGADARAALETLTSRHARGAPSASPDHLVNELRALFESYRRGPIPPAVAESIAARWQALFLAAPARARTRGLTDYVLEDTTPCALLLQRLDGEPSAALACLVCDVVSLAADDDDRTGLFLSTVCARWAWLSELARAGRAVLSANDWRYFANHLTSIARDAIEHELEHNGASVPPDVAARIAERWHQLYRFAPERAIDFIGESIKDSAPYALLLDRLCTEDPCVPLGRLVDEILGDVAIAVDETLDREQLAPFADAVRRNSAALQRIADATRAAGESGAAERIERTTAELGA